jgi:cephalosporin hydroxylase
MKLLSPIDKVCLEYERFGLKCQQNKYALQLIDEIFNEFKPELIVELGARTGGLSVFLSLYAFNKNIECLIFENDPQCTPLKYESIINFLKSTILYDDVYSENTINLIKNKMQNKKSVIFCDAIKTKDFNTYGALLKSGDIILAHDYAHDKEDFKDIEKNKIWMHNEIIYSDIKEVCESNNLVYLDHDLFKMSAWGVFIKR